MKGNETEKTIMVDFNAKDSAREAGAKVKNGKWTIRKTKNIDEIKVDNIEAKNKLKNLVQRIANKEENIDASNTQLAEHLSISDNLLCDEENDNFWDNLLDFRNWNALVAVQSIKKDGLPRLERQREKMLGYFANVRTFKVGEQYPVGYKDICDYCEAFNKAYGFETVGMLQRKHNINGFNFESNLNTSAMTNEEKELFRFVFPISIKTSVRELEDEYENEKPISPLEYEDGEMI